MLQALPSAARYRVKSVSIPAPIGGLNSRDSLDAMPQTDAIVMSNWFPTVEKVTVREGYSSFCTGIGTGDVETVVNHNAGANNQLLAVGSNGTLYQIDTGSAVSKKTGLSNGRFQTAEFNNNTIFVNGADTPFGWDGSSASNLTITLSDSSSSATLKGVHVFKNRVYYWRGTDQNFYYSATVDTFAGNFTKFPVGLVGTFGGNIIQIGSLSIDGGEGVDDLLVVMMSSGEALVYSGSYPGDSAFALIGTFRIAEPVNEPRAMAKLGGDLIVMTKEGYLPLSQVFRQDLAGNKAVALSEKIRGTVIRQVAKSGTSFGWQIHLSADGSKMYFNHPTGDTTDAYNQHIFNPITRAWALFQNIPAITFANYSGDTYFGTTSGKVYKVGGTADITTAISADISFAYNYFGDRGSIKRFSSVAPMLEALGDINFDFGVAVDQQAPSGLTLATGTYVSELATWDSAEWDEDFWGDTTGAGIIQKRKVVGRLGRSASLRVKVASTTQTISILSSNFHYLPGGPL
tara:strand:- start:1117 stop:2664 length:1548 start_codon:yes stop_codon:yes gene_type:complete